MSDFEAVVRWYLVLTLMAAVGLPIGTIILGDSRRYAAWFSRPIGMLAVFFPTWFLSSAFNLPYTTIGLWVTLAVLAALAWGYARRAKLIDFSTWPVVIAAEAATLVSFLGALYLRGFTPNILNTEKPMDAAFLASTIRADRMPAPDPWMAGESINYYYIGYAIHGAIARMSGIAVGQAYNLALITTTAILVAVVIGTVATALPRWAKVIAPLAVFLIVISGNMVAPYRYLENGRSEWNLSFFQGIAWTSTRVVWDGPIYAISEFPSFSIILGDLHPHLTALPFTLVVLALAIVIARQAGLASIPSLVAAGILGGALYGMNTWDLPTYLGLILLAILWNARSLVWRDRLIRLAIAGLSAAIAWAPFILKFTPPGGISDDQIPSAVRSIPILKTLFKTVGGNGFDYTSAGEFLKVFGLQYMLICVALAFMASELPASLSDSRLVRQIGIAASLFLVLALLAGIPVLVFAAIPGSIAGWVLYKKTIASLEGLISALFLAGAFLIVLTEFFYIHDIYKSRMNTLFKAYFQIWTLWGIGAALALGYVLTNASVSVSARTRRVAFSVVATVAIILGILYPITGIKQWVDFYNAPHAWAGLNGTDWVDTANPDEFAGISFITDHADNKSVVVEAPGCSYQPISRIPFDRVSIFTGVPTVIGWYTTHEPLWRGGSASWLQEITQRVRDVRAFYSDPTQTFVDRYDIDFVYYGIYEAGEGESEDCPDAIALPKPTDEQMGAIGFGKVFEQGDVTIWQREKS